MDVAGKGEVTLVKMELYGGEDFKQQKAKSEESEDVVDMFVVLESQQSFSLNHFHNHGRPKVSNRRQSWN